MDKVIIFDTTLRDGEQAAGGTMNAREKLGIAQQLDKLGVDIIEAGMPVNSQTELQAVKPVEAVRDSNGELWLVKLQVRTNPKLGTFKDCDLVLRVKTGQVVK